SYCRQLRISKVCPERRQCSPALAQDDLALGPRPSIRNAELIGTLPDPARRVANLAAKLADQLVQGHVALGDVGLRGRRASGSHALIDLRARHESPLVPFARAIVAAIGPQLANQTPH